MNPCPNNAQGPVGAHASRDDIAGIAENQVRRARWFKFVCFDILRERDAGHPVDDLAEQHIIGLVVAVADAGPGFERSQFDRRRGRVLAATTDQRAGALAVRQIEYLRQT